MSGAALDNLSDNLSQRGCRRLHGRRRGRQLPGAKHVVCASPEQHQLTGVEAAVSGQIARHLLIHWHFYIADHGGEKVVQVRRRCHRGAALRIAKAALRTQLMSDVDRIRSGERIAIVLGDILSPYLSWIGCEPPSADRAGYRRIGPDVRQTVAERDNLQINAARRIGRTTRAASTSAARGQQRRQHGKNCSAYPVIASLHSSSATGWPGRCPHAAGLSPARLHIALAICTFVPPLKQKACAIVRITDGCL